MDAIRKAQEAEVDALEEIVGALASKQQTSIAQLRKQMDAIMAWRAEMIGKERKVAQRRREADATNVKVNEAGDSETRYTVTREQESALAGAAATPEDTGTVEGSDNESDAAPFDLLVEDIEKDRRGMPEELEERVEQGVPLSDDVVFLMHRVAVLERDLVKLQGMWDMNKGQRVIEVWMGMLNRKRYKPSDIEDPVECAVVTLQNWWRDMLVTKLDWSSSSGSSTFSGKDELSGEESGSESSPRTLEPGEVIKENDYPARKSVSHVTSDVVASELHRLEEASSASENSVEDNEPVAIETAAKHEVSVREAPPEEERIDRHASSASSRHHRDHHHHHHDKDHHKHHNKDHHKDHKALESGSGVQGMFDGAIGGNPILMITSMAMQLQSQETELENLQHQVSKLELMVGEEASKHRYRGIAAAHKRAEPKGEANNDVDHHRPEQRHSDYDQISSEAVSEMGRSLGELQRELQVVRERAEDREKRTEHSLEELETLIAAKDEDTNRRFQEQAQENKETINKLLERLGTGAEDEKVWIIREALIGLKLELRSLYSSLDAISGNEISANQLRSMEGIRHLLASFSERSRVLEEEIGDPSTLAQDIVAGNVSARRFGDMATDLGTTLFAFIKAQVLMARRARDGSTDAATKVHRRASNAEVAAAVVDANFSGGDGGGAGGDDGEVNGPGWSSVTGASPQAWAKLGYLTYTRDKNSEKMPFPAGMVGLLKALTDVLDHCVGTGDLAIRLSVTLEDLTVYVAQRADKERESVIRHLSAPVDGVKGKLGEMEETLAGFQRTMHLVLSEVDADRQRSAAIAALGTTVKTMQSLFSRLSDDLESKAGASEIEKALEDMTLKINQATNEQSKLQRLGRALGKDQNSSAAMKRLQIELEQARATAILAMVPSDKDVLIGSRCLSCNRPLGGFSAPQAPKGVEEWYTGAGGLGGPKDRILEARGGGIGEGDGKSGGGRGSTGAGMGSSRSPGRTQPSITPSTILPADSASSEGSGAVPKKGLQGPLLFERTGMADGAVSASGTVECAQVGTGGRKAVFDEQRSNYNVNHQQRPPFLVIKARLGT
eukprot:g3998.t2